MKKEETKQPFPIEEVESLVKRNFPESDEVKVTLLSAGRFNTVYHVEGDGELSAGLILKIGPVKNTPIMICERDILRTDYKILELFKRKDLPLSKPVSIDITKKIISHDYYFRTYLEGEPISFIDFSAQKELKVSLMKHLSALHSQEGNYFGYVKEYTKFRFKLWAGAFYAMVTDALNDAHNLKCRLPAAAISAAIKKNRANLDEIRKPRLVVNNLSEGNVLVKKGEQTEISGIIDFETALYGDPLMDFASRGFLLKNAENDAELIEAYEESGLRLPKDPRAKARIQMYRMFKYVLNAVEAKRTLKFFKAHFAIAKERRKINKLLKILLYKSKSLNDGI